MSKASEYQPNPKPGRENVADYVLRDIAERIETGERKYGTKLQTFNGRDALWDAYQEGVDYIFYIRQHILEMDDLWSRITNLYAHLAGKKYLGEEDIAKLVDLLEQILEKKPAQPAEGSSSQNQE